MDMKLVLEACGKALPEQIIDNDWFAARLDTSDEWIRQRTGIRERRLAIDIAGPGTVAPNSSQSGIARPDGKIPIDGTQVANLALDAARRCLKNFRELNPTAAVYHTTISAAGSDAAFAENSDKNTATASEVAKAVDVATVATSLSVAARIKYVLVATMSAEQRMPNIASQLIEPLGLNPNVLAFDINAACTGFVYSLETASALLKTQPPDSLALVIGAERLSSLLDFSDRSTAVLFGDGAAATLWSVEPGPKDIFISGTETAPLLLYTDADQHIRMEGRAVFRYATSTLPRVLQELAEVGELETDAIDYFLLHQANSRIIDSISSRLNLPAERFPQNLALCGNTSAASLPLLLADLWSDGTLSRTGQQNLNICLAAFGAGMSYGSVLMRRNS